MAFSIVHLTTKANIGTGVQTISIPAVAAGNALLVVLASDFTGGQLAGITDSANDKFTRALYPATTGIVGTGDIWYCLSPAAGANSIVITPGGYSPGIWIYEISAGGQPILLDDAEQQGTTTAVTSCTGPTVAASGASDFFVAACGTAKNVTTVSSPWSLDPLLASPTSGTQGAAHYFGAGTQVPTFTQDAASGYIVVAASFKTATGAEPNYVQSAFTGGSPNTVTATATVSLPNPATAGNTILVMVITDGAPVDVTATVSDSLGDTYSLAYSGLPGNQYSHCQPFTATVTVGGHVTVTVGLSSNSGNILGYMVHVAEYVGLGPVDGVATASNFNPSGTCTVNLTTTATDVLLMVTGVLGSSPTITPNAPDYALRSSGTYSSGVGAVIHSVLESSAGPGTQSVSFSYTGVAYANGNAVLWLWAFQGTVVSGCQPATLAQAITDLCVRAGLTCSEVDVSLITGANVQPVEQLRGYVVERPTTAAECLQEIMRAYFIDACETGGKVRFVPRGMLPSPLTIAEGDLGLIEDNAKLIEQQSQAEDLPVSTTVFYNDALVNYQQGKQIKQRNPRILTVATRNQNILSLPFTLLPDEARQVAEADLYSKWCNRLSYKMNLWRGSWALLDPCDTVKFVYEGKTFNMRLLSVQIGQNLTAALEGVLEDYRNYNSIIAGSASSGSGMMATDPGGGVSTGSGATGVGPPALAPTMLWLLDIPYLQDADAKPGSSGFYAVFSSGTSNWAGATLYESHDDASFAAIGGVKLAASFGYPTAALAAPVSPWAWDTANTLTIQMANGTLAGSTDAAVLAGANGLIVGQEILQFVNCTDNGGGSFTISRLLRGRRGTDNFCGTHAAGEVAFAPLAGGLLHQAEPVSHIGQLWYYRGVTSGGNVASATDVDLTLAGNDLKPYSVVDIGGTLDTSNNWTITWRRRTRAGGFYGTGADSLIDGLNGPLNEQTEAYQVDVMSGTTVKRTISTNVATAVYTATQQTVDFGAAQTTLTVNIYQMSATVGRGFKATATLPISGGAPAASVVSGDVYVN